MTVAVDPAPPAERTTIEHLFQLYVHDFSEYWRGTSRGELNRDGLFEIPSLDSYWRTPDCKAYLIRASGQLAGFALLNKEGHASAEIDANMAEFFVVRKHRTAGVGRAAAHMLFARHEGVWETAVARANHRALSFWRGTIRAFQGVGDIEERDQNDGRWNGTVFRFRTR